MSVSQERVDAMKALVDSGDEEALAAWFKRISDRVTVSGKVYAAEILAECDDANPITDHLMRQEWS